MAKRPIFSPQYKEDETVKVQVKEIEFKWHPGMAKIQKRKSISDLHANANKLGISPILEISSKSPDELGFNLSAFNLKLDLPTSQSCAVEVAFQGSKVFEKGGPFRDIFNGTAIQAKKDRRLENSGKLIGFKYFDMEFPLKPRTFFYDWLYINALCQNRQYSGKLLEYEGFTDIEFNPEKSINCQAFSAALFVSLKKAKLLEKAMSSRSEFLKIAYPAHSKKENSTFIQPNLF